MAYIIDVVVSVLGFLSGIRQSVITEANRSTKVLGDLMLKLTEEANEFKDLEKEKRAEFELRIWGIQYDLVYGIARARALAKGVAVDVTDQARSTVAGGIDVAKKPSVLAEEAAVAIMDQARSTTEDVIVVAVKVREDLESNTRELERKMAQVFKKTASLLVTATFSGKISTAAAVNIGDIEEMGEGLKPSLSLNQNPDQPMCWIQTSSHCMRRS